MDDRISGQNAGELSASILKTALAIEEFGIEFYSRMAGCVAEETGSALLMSLAGDEREHKAIIEQELGRLAATSDVEAAEPMGEYLSILPEKAFVPPPGGACLLLNDEIAALEKGIDVEILSKRMYDDAIQMSRDEKVVRTLRELSKWETRHRELLEENLRLLRLEGAWYGYGPILDG